MSPLFQSPAFWILLALNIATLLVLLGLLRYCLNVRSQRTRLKKHHHQKQHEKSLIESDTSILVHYLCCVLCCPPLPSRIVAKAVFFPPTPPHYEFRRDSSCRTGFKVWLSPSRRSDIPRQVYSHQMEAFYLSTRTNHRIACIYYNLHPNPLYTILHSHSNGGDIGTMAYIHYLLASQMGCNLLAYDYSGYGASTGTPSEAKMYEAAETVFRALKRRRFGLEKIILLGQSIGSVPTVHLASRNMVAGVIIMSGILSAYKIFFPKSKRKVAHCCNHLSNIDKLGLIKSPTLIIHGQKDETVPFANAIEMVRLCPNTVRPLWLKDGDHMDLESFPELWDRLRQFVMVELDADLSFEDMPTMEEQSGTVNSNGTSLHYQHQHTTTTPNVVNCSINVNITQ